MPKKRSRVESGVHIEIDSHSQSPAEAEPSTASTTSTGKSVTLRLAKRGRYTQEISHTEVEEVVADETSQGGGDDREYDDDGLLDTDFGASTLEDTPNPESVREEVEADAENVKKTASSVHEWVEHRQEYVDEFLRLDGLGDIDNEPMCAACATNSGLYKCKDCFGEHLYCVACALNLHRLLPLHQILKWSGTHFQEIMLYSLGLRVHLGHDGDACPCPRSILEGFTVFDINGIHLAGLVFCGCIGAPRNNIQLLRMRWFPGTVKDPHSAYTFDVLNTFHLLNLQGKLSLHDFYHALHRKCDNAGVHEYKDRYEQILPVMRIWCHIKMVKRAGRGHDPQGVVNTKMGQCAVECPACPSPRWNLPQGWKNAPAHKRWLYQLIITIDANYRLKLKEKGLVADKPLGDGWSHFVQTAPYRAYIKLYGDYVEPNICDSELHAADHSTKKSSTAFRASGVGGVLCGRHALVRKNGIRDLQQGERFANMDFIIFSAIYMSLVLLLTFSYDICCQWSRNLLKRVPQLPQALQPASDILSSAKLVIPKFHLHNHGLKCQLNFNLNFLRGSAQSDLEDPERFLGPRKPGQHEHEGNE
ncbi:hypothetical protein FIBSPDRAFT_895199 [Athelia psychrophila]|uniref:CxC2-like cysteine cluster KDZ transposase-associated domain-containing protein n=1 Tax=Athelia psychrophila TaxID=1759441 RepID=A0A166EVG8_9AGAM|nr:hypothetical protein FIBSPDRAFT_895199 [Fibularhizoctonia sp. CBS 109695]